MTDKSDASTGGEFLARIEADRCWRREHPREFLAELADDLWSTMPPAEAAVYFRIRAEAAPWWGVDAVECLERLVAIPPPWLPEVLQTGGAVWLPEASEQGPDPYVEWLRERTADVRAELEVVRRLSGR